MTNSPLDLLPGYKGYKDLEARRESDKQARLAVAAELAGAGLAVRAVNGSVEGIVSDTGPGIPEEELPRVFERFYRLEKSRTRGEDNRRGSGLGLAIVEELVHAHGGRISVSSQVGQGTTYYTPIEKGRTT